ncbi:MAG TPA: polyprenol monophosphomannose synthase [Vicinamibacterales bacterium]|nr:polyprenol monophosphomannose synthase [Vicinamibacterales bacterium]
MSGPRALVIVPTYNERRNLPVLIDGLMKHSYVSVLVVDDSSPDGTGDLADDLASTHAGRIHVLHRTNRRGLGRSYIDGIRWAIAQPDEDVHAICQMDADLSHDPARVPALVDAIANADVALGSRYVDGGAIVNWPMRRKILSRFANLYIRTVTRLPVRDCTTGFRCWRRDALAALPLDRFDSDGYSFLVEMLFVATAMGKTIVEVPITFVERRQGESKLSSGVLLESAITPWRLVARRGQQSFRAMV